MSIAYFPKVYEDELVYSVLARYYAHSGYLFRKVATYELSVKPQLKIDREFIKNLKPEVVEHLTKELSFDELLQKHTMYPYHGRFIDNNRRKNAYEALIKMDGDFSKIFGVPQSKTKEKRFFKYCPMCVQNDRENWGETYWHRIPQIRGIRVCPYHHCYYINSSVAVDSEASFKLIPAEEAVLEEEVLQKEIVYCNNEVEIQLARYIAGVFLQPIHIDNETVISDFLHLKLVGTPYISSRGRNKYFSKLLKNMKIYFDGVLWIDGISVEDMQRTLNGKRFVFEEICMIAMFLQIDIEELVEMQTTSKTPEQLFDDKVQELIESGKSYIEISRELNVDPSIIRWSDIISNREDTNRRIPKTNTKTTDWATLDKEILPLVEQAIKDLQGNGETRPCRVTAYAVGKMLDIAPYKFKKMKMCNQALIDGNDSKETYIARKVLWALNEMKKKQIVLKWWELEQLTRCDRTIMMENLPYLIEIAPPEIVEMFESIT